MAIIPPFVRSYILTYWQPLLAWFSQLTYANLLPRADDHLLCRLHTHLDFQPLERACVLYHHQTGPGAPPTHPVPRLVRALLVGYLWHWSTRQLEFQLRFNLLVKWFCGYAVEEAGPDHSTLNRFEVWVSLHQPRTFFDETLRQIDAQFPGERTQAQVGDTFALQADAAKEGLVPLLRHTCRRLLGSLSRLAPAQHADIATHLHDPELFGAPDEKDEFWLAPAERLARVRRTVLAAQACAAWVQVQLAAQPQLTTAQQRPVQQWLDRLTKIIGDEVVITTPREGGAVEVTPVEKHAPGSYRLGSATDPDATYRVHGEDQSDLGYNVQVAVSENFVRAIEANTGAQPDNVGIPDLLTTQQEHQGFLPPQLIYDAAGGEGKTRARVAEATAGQTQLVAPLPVKDKNSPLFKPEQFTVSEDGQALTCPNGKTTEIAYGSGSGDGRTFRFLGHQCAGCPLWDKCRTQQPGSTRMRQVFISDYRKEVEAARAYNQTPEFKAELKQRPRVERIIAALVRYNGARRARRRGQAKADFQMKLCATAYNLKKWMQLLRLREHPAKAPPDSARTAVVG